LILAYAIFLVTYLGFALTRNVVLIAVLFVFYGLYQGIFRSVGKALASDYVPEQLRASGIGWYSATVGLFGLVASLVAGWLWDQVGHVAVFLFSASFAVVGGFETVDSVSSKFAVDWRKRPSSPGPPRI
jgi:MFS family permease